ncbi:hypothetical protein ACFFLM_01295 [Deinococcus oregonensis]|uniref:DUF11 domain-containing protein n=1 Tax=Deinococcus oregonensis TaxID=1805970 RepID=A0ABV6AT13_9DEIO
MKVNSRLIALMVAMAAGTAAAAGTPAGTVISNTATANFTDPSTGTAATPVNSNAVTTTVLPIAGFDIQYATTTADGTTGNNTGGTNPIPGAYIVDGVVPTDTTKNQVATAYVAVNTGNVNNYVVNLAVNDTGSPAGAPASVKYYPAAADADNDGILTKAEVAAADAAPVGDPRKAITSVTIPADDVNTTGIDEGQVKFFQVLVVPSSATSGAIYAASPQGSAPAGAGTVASNTYPAVNELATDLQFTQAIVTTPTVTLEPPADTTPSTPGNTPPVPGTVPGTTTPNPNTYTPPTNPGVTPNPGTLITADPATGNQDAYPKADANTLPDVVTFVSDVKNGGTLPDTMVITVGLPAGATSVVVLDKDGNVLTPVSGKYTLPGGPVAPGASVPFQVVVTYPDSNGVAAPVDLVVPIGVFSGNVPSVTPLDTGTLTVHPPQMIFGDTVAGSNPSPAPAPVETVKPGGAFNTTTGTTADASAVFPVSIKNTGTYGDTFTLVGTVTILLTDGTPVNVPVTYYNADGSPLATPGTTLVIAPGATSNYLAVVNIPPTAAATTGTTGTNPQPSLTQTATGVYSTIVATDTNDQIKVDIVNTKPTDSTDPTTGPSNANSGIAVAKYQTKGATAPAPVAADINTLTALPGDTIRYAIIAKNNFNTPVANFVLSDSAAANNVYTYSNLVSATATATGFTGIASPTVFYKVNGAAWSTTAPAAGTVITTLDVAVDTNGDNTITATDIVPALASIRLDIAVTIK